MSSAMYDPTWVMVFEKLIRYAGLAVGLKPSARGCEGRLRGLYRIMYSKTITLCFSTPPQCH